VLSGHVFVKIRRTTRDLIAIGLRCSRLRRLVRLSLFDVAHGLSLDMLTALRWQMFGARVDPRRIARRHRRV